MKCMFSCASYIYENGKVKAIKFGTNGYPENVWRAAPRRMEEVENNIQEELRKIEEEKNNPKFPDPELIFDSDTNK